jgi:hypothetical protein
MIEITKEEFDAYCVRHKMLIYRRAAREYAKTNKSAIDVSGKYSISRNTLMKYVKAFGFEKEVKAPHTPTRRK